MSRLLLCLPLMGLIAVAGCGDGGRLSTHPVTGTVLLNKTPLVGATVTFSPKDPTTQRAAVGRTDDNGKFTLTTYDSGDGAAPGSYDVLIRKFDMIAASGDDGADDDGHSADANAETVDPGHSAKKASTDSTGNMLPSKYSAAATTPFHETVKADGDNVFEFSIE